MRTILCAPICYKALGDTKRQWCKQPHFLTMLPLHPQTEYHSPTAKAVADCQPKRGLICFATRRRNWYKRHFALCIYERWAPHVGLACPAMLEFFVPYRSVRPSWRCFGSRSKTIWLGCHPHNATKSSHNRSVAETCHISLTVCMITVPGTR